MTTSEPKSLEERKFELELEKFKYEKSITKFLLTVSVPISLCFVTTGFGFVQWHSQREETKRLEAQRNSRLIEESVAARERDQREWGIKIIELYLTKRDLFDFNKNPDTASVNLSALQSISPAVVAGMLRAELENIPRPGQANEPKRIKSLEAIEKVREGEITENKWIGDRKPRDYKVFIQYGENNKLLSTKIGEVLSTMGFNVPASQIVQSTPDRVEIRYYRPEQAQFAMQLLADLQKAVPGVNGNGKVLQIKSKNRLPDGILEVWVP